MEPERCSIVRRLIWAGIGLLGVGSVACLAWAIESKRQGQERRQMALKLERTGTELQLAWLAAGARLERAQRACGRLRPGPRNDSWLCERVPCNDLPLVRPEDRTPRLLRGPTLVGDTPRRPERW